MGVRDYRDLIVWQKGMDLVAEVYRLTRGFPSEELYGLTNQVRRAAVSIPSNIAEGQARQSTAEFRHFLSIAQGSRAGVETQLLIAVRLNYSTESGVRTAVSLLTEIQKMLAVLQARLQ
jgi:four helix bundle protein